MSNSLSVIVLPQTDSDADAIFEWLRQKSPPAALRWYEAFLCALHVLVKQGDVFALAPESHRIDRRIQQKLFSTPRGRTYRILYQIEGERLYVLHIRAPGQKLIPAKEVRHPD